MAYLYGKGNSGEGSAAQHCRNCARSFHADSLTSIGRGAFSGCGKLKLVDLADNVESIGDGAFLACQGLRQIRIPKGLTTLGKYAFALCKELKDVDLSGTQLAVIPERAFDCCESLESLTLSKKVKKIEKRAFFGCTELSRLNALYENPVTEIGDYAFEKTNLYNIMDFADLSVKIGAGVFARNEVDRYDSGDYHAVKKQIALPTSATLAEGAFYGAMIDGIDPVSEIEEARYTVVDGSVYTDDGKTLLVYFPKAVDNEGSFAPTKEAEQKIFHVPDGVTRIAPYAFFECGLEQIYLPGTVTEISDNAFTRSGIAPELGMITDCSWN